MKFRKFIPILAAFAIITSAFAAVPAHAQEQSRLRPPRLFLGKITEVGDGEFTVEKRDGSQLSFQVDERTRYRDRLRSELSSDDLQAGRWVSVLAGRRESDSIRAWLILLLPEGFDPDEIRVLRGRITSVDLSAGSFILQARDQDHNVKVDTQTIYRGRVSGLEDLKEGMLALVVLDTVSVESSAQVVAAGERGDLPYFQRRFPWKIRLPMIFQ